RGKDWSGCNSSRSGGIDCRPRHGGRRAVWTNSQTAGGSITLNICSVFGGTSSAILHFVVELAPGGYRTAMRRHITARSAVLWKPLLVAPSQSLELGRSCPMRRTL